MQLGNSFCYQISIGRVVTYLTLRTVPIPYLPDSQDIALYDVSTKKSRRITIPDIYNNNSLEMKLNFVQSGLDLYIYSKGRTD